MFDLSKVLIFKCHRQLDNIDALYDTAGDYDLTNRPSLNRTNNNSIKINPVAPNSSSEGATSTKDLRQIPWIKIIKKKNELPTVELVTRVRYKLWGGAGWSDADFEDATGKGATQSGCGLEKNPATQWKTETYVNSKNDKGENIRREKIIGADNHAVPTFPPRSFEQALIPYFKFWHYNGPRSAKGSSHTHAFTHPIQLGSIQGFPLFDVGRTPENWPVWHGGPHPLYTGLVERLKHKDDTTWNGGDYLSGNGGTYKSNDTPEDFLLKQVQFDLPAASPATEWSGEFGGPIPKNVVGRKPPLDNTDWIDPFVDHMDAVPLLAQFHPPNTIDLSEQKNIIIIDFRGLGMRWTEGDQTDFCGNPTSSDNNVKLKYLILRIKSSTEKVEEERYKPFEPDLDHWPKGHHGNHDYKNTENCSTSNTGTDPPEINNFKWGSGYGSGSYCKWYNSKNENPPNAYYPPYASDGVTALPKRIVVSPTSDVDPTNDIRKPYDIAPASWGNTVYDTGSSTLYEDLNKGFLDNANATGYGSCADDQYPDDDDAPAMFYSGRLGLCDGHEFWVTYTFTCDLIGPYEALDFSTKLLYTNDPSPTWGRNTHFPSTSVQESPAGSDISKNNRSNIFPQWVSIHDSEGNEGQEQNGVTYPAPKHAAADNDNYKDLYVNINIWPKPYSSFEQAGGAGGGGLFWNEGDTAHDGWPGAKRWGRGSRGNSSIYWASGEPDGSNRPYHGLEASTQLIGGCWTSLKANWRTMWFVNSKNGQGSGGTGAERLARALLDQELLFRAQYNGIMTISGGWSQENSSIQNWQPGPFRDLTFDLDYENGTTNPPGAVWRGYGQGLLLKDAHSILPFESPPVFLPGIIFGSIKNGYAEVETDNSFNSTFGQSTYMINNLLWCSLRSPRHLDISCGDFNSQNIFKNNPILAWPNSRRYIPNFVKLTEYGWKSYAQNQLNESLKPFPSTDGIEETIFEEVMRHRAKCRGGGYAKNPKKQGWSEATNILPDDGCNVIDLPRRSKNPYYGNRNALTGAWNGSITDQNNNIIDQYATPINPTVEFDTGTAGTLGYVGTGNVDATEKNGTYNYFDIYYKLLVPPSIGQKVTITFKFGNGITNENGGPSVVTFFRYSDMDGVLTPTGKSSDHADRTNETIKLTWEGKANDISGTEADMPMYKITIFDIASGTSVHEPDITTSGTDDVVLFSDLIGDSKKNYKFTANVCQLFLVNPEKALNNNIYDDNRPENSSVSYNQNTFHNFDISFIPYNMPIYSYNNAQEGARGGAGVTYGNWGWCSIEPYQNIKDLSWNIQINATTLVFRDVDTDLAFNDRAVVDISLSTISNWSNAGFNNNIGGGKEVLRLVPRENGDLEDEDYIINIPLVPDQAEGLRQKIFIAVKGGKGPLIWKNGVVENGWEDDDKFANYTNHPFSKAFLEAIASNEANQIKIPHPDIFDQENMILDYWKWYNLINVAEVSQGNNPGSSQNLEWITYENQIQTLSLVTIISLTTEIKYMLISDINEIRKNNQNVEVESTITVIGYPIYSDNKIVIKINKNNSDANPIYLPGLTQNGVNVVNLSSKLLENNYITFGISTITQKSIGPEDDHDDWYELFSNIQVFGPNSSQDITINYVNITNPTQLFLGDGSFLSDDNKIIYLKWNNGGEPYNFNQEDGDIYWTISRINQLSLVNKILISNKILSLTNGVYEYQDTDLRIYDKYKYKISGEYKWKLIDNEIPIELSFTGSFNTEVIFICKNNQFQYGRYNTTSTNLKLYRPLLINSKEGQCDELDKNGQGVNKCVGGECTAEYNASRSRGGSNNIYANTTNQLTKKQTYVNLSKSSFRPFR